MRPGTNISGYGVKMAGSPVATLLHVAQNEEFDGDRSMGSRAFAFGPTLALQRERDNIVGSEGKGTRYLGRPHRLFGPAARKGAEAAPVHGSENGRNEVPSNGGKQLIPADRVKD
jgi:hypothetical protein